MSTWKRIARRFAGCPAVFGYDLLNEPFFGARSPVAFEANVLGPLNEELLAAVRAQDPDRVVFFEPQLQVGLFVTCGLPRMSDPNVVYAPHWYDPVVDLREAAGLVPHYDGNPGSTAAALDRLEQKGFVRSVRGEPSPMRGGKRKRLFEATPLGLRAARDLRRVRERIWQTIEAGRRS